MIRQAGPALTEPNEVTGFECKLNQYRRDQG